MKQSPQGHKADAGKNRLELLPFDALDEVGQVMTLGAAKYGDRNWERGINYDRVFGALMRHAWAWFRGQDKDPETGLSHMAHCAANALFLLSYERRGRRGLDNRPRQVIMKEDEKALRRELNRLHFAQRQYKDYLSFKNPEAVQDIGQRELARLDAREKEIYKLLGEGKAG